MALGAAAPLGHPSSVTCARCAARAPPPLSPVPAALLGHPLLCHLCPLHRSGTPSSVTCAHFTSRAPPPLSPVPTSPLGHLLLCYLYPPPAGRSLGLETQNLNARDLLVLSELLGSVPKMSPASGSPLDADTVPPEGVYFPPSRTIRCRGPTGPSAFIWGAAGKRVGARG